MSNSGASPSGAKVIFEADPRPMTTPMAMINQRRGRLA